jgi:F-type H+-transporting ATPase subunit b
MRIRRLVLVGVFAAGVLAAAATPAFAADPGKLHGEDLLKCIKKAIRDNKPEISNSDPSKNDYKPFENALENCSKAKSIITPAVPEMIWGGIAFAIVAFVLMKFAFPGIKKSLATRQDKIRGDLEGAETARREAEEEKTRYESQLGDARAEGNRIVEEARVAAEQVRRDVLAKAEADAAEVRSRAQSDAQLASARAMDDLQRRVADLSIELAEKIVEHSLDHDTQLALVESYISSVGNGQR